MKRVSLIVAAMLVAAFAAATAGADAPQSSATAKAADAPKTPASAPAADSAPAAVKTLAMVKGPWTDAVAGMAIVTRLAGGASRTDEVVAADDATVTIKTVVSTSADSPIERQFPRLHSPASVQLIADSHGPKSGEATINIAGKEYRCQIHTRQTQLGDKIVTTRIYVCREIPGWTVRIDNDASGRMVTAAEVVQIKQ